MGSQWPHLMVCMGEGTAVCWRKNQVGILRDTQRETETHTEIWKQWSWEKQGSRETQRKKKGQRHRSRKREQRRRMKGTQRRVDTQRKIQKQPLKSTILPSSSAPTPPALGGHKGCWITNPLLCPGQQSRCLDVTLVPLGLYGEHSTAPPPTAPLALSSCPAAPPQSLRPLPPTPRLPKHPQPSPPYPGAFEFSQHLDSAKFISPDPVQCLPSTCTKRTAEPGA